MLSETTAMYREEQAAIETLRAAYPKEPQKTLANRIIRRNHFVGTEANLALIGGNRTFYSIYSVIRRYDKRIKAALDAATHGRHPLSAA